MTASRTADVMQRLDSLKVTPVWVDPNHLVESARVLMDGHDLSAICILDRDGRPIGILRRDIAANIPSNARVGEVMEPVLGVLQSNESLRQAADLLVRIERHYAPMVNGTEFRGMVTALDLLDGLRRSWDPMTDLPWSDELRRWGAEQLDEGREIAVVFIDLDRFGTFNKRFGHVVGDRVLTRMAAFLREETDPERDILVRYGGDEFAVGTLRSAAEAQVLAQSLLTTSQVTPLKESGESISFSVGVYGGQRQRERDDMHVQATLDDLINLASRRCIASKNALGEAAESGTAVVSAPSEEPALPAFMSRPTTDAPADAPADAPSDAPSDAPTDPETSAELPSAQTSPIAPEEDRVREASNSLPIEAETPAVESPLPAEDAPAAIEASQTPEIAEATVPVESPARVSDEDSPSVVEVQVEDDPNSLTHVVLKGGGRVWVGVGLRLGRTLESTVAYATGKALERAYAGKTLRIDDVREEAGRFVVQATRMEDGRERAVSAVAQDNSPEAVADATIAAFLA